MRLPLIVLVTFAHSYGAVRSDFTLLSGNIDGYELLKLMVSQTLVKVVVPVFYIVSGYLFFANVSQWNVRVYRQKLLRRAKTLLLPYVVWNLLMAVKLGAVSWTTFWAYWTAAGVQTDWLGNQQLMTAPANMPLWFLRDLIVISLLSPVVFVAVRYLGRWLLAVMAIAAVVLTIGIMFFTDRNGLYCLIMVSFCMSLMFATIYGISLRNMGRQVKLASAGMTMAVSGGALFPAFQAAIIDAQISFLGLPATNISFIIPLVCFCVVAVYGHRGYVRHSIASQYYG